MGGSINYRELKALARRADRARDEKQRRLVENLIKEFPKLDLFEGYDEFTIWLAKLLVRVKWFDASKFS
ncbi:hypothetical protein ES706_00183 [subsurface metagenome]|nr:hypothetical protein [Hadesarchaea archaeon]